MNIPDFNLLIAEIIGEDECKIPKDKRILSLFKRYITDKYHVDGETIWHIHHWRCNSERLALQRKEAAIYKEKVIKRTEVYDKLIIGIQQYLKCSEDNAKLMAHRVLMTGNPKAAEAFGLDIKEFHELGRTHYNIDTKLLI